MIGCANHAIIDGIAERCSATDQRDRDQCGDETILNRSYTGIVSNEPKKKNIVFMPHSDSVYLETTQVGSTITGLPAVASNNAQRIRIVLQDGSADSI